MQQTGEPNGIDRCDDEPSAGKPFYGGPSASKTYDERFAQVGGDDNPLPHLKDEHTPQGLAYWPDWDPAGHPGDDLLLVTSYYDSKDDDDDTAEEAWIYGIDAATGAHVGTAGIAASHVGGIAIYKDWAYVSAQGSAAVNRFDLAKLRDSLNEPGDDLLDPVGEPEKVAAAAFLTTDGSTLYAGPYKGANDEDQPFLRSYAIQEDGSIEDLGTRRFLVPRRTQGMTIANGKFIYSTSPYFGDHKRSYLFVVDERTDFDPDAAECFRAPSMTEELVTHDDKLYLAFESGSVRFPEKEGAEPPDNRIEHLHVGMLDAGDGPDEGDTKTTYTGPAESDYHDPFTATAQLVDRGGPTEDVRLDFILGEGGDGQTCSGTTDSAGVASCSLTPTQRPGATTLTVRFAGAPGLGASSDTVPFTVTKQQTAVRYTGPERLANGTSARLSAVLTEESTEGAPVAGRPVTLALGEGGARQACTGETDGDGVAACVIDVVNQPLNDAATVPVSVAFDGDAFYQPSNATATALLEYYTGRAYGLTAEAGLLGVRVPPTPDTGPVRTAQATRTDPGCTAEASVPLLLRSGTLCARVVTSLAPGTSRATATVENATIGLPGLPVIEIEGATARSTSTCGAATGKTDLRLRVAGKLIDVTGEPNAVIDLPGAARLVINEHHPVPDADHGVTVNALHLTTAGGVDVVLASATSGVHNCAT